MESISDVNLGNCEECCLILCSWISGFNTIPHLFLIGITSPSVAKLCKMDLKVRNQFTIKLMYMYNTLVSTELTRL